MSTIKDNLVQIREKLDTENTQPSGGGVLEEVKKIRQVLDTDNVYPDGGGLAEEICAIRELVQDGKGGCKSRPDYHVQKCRITNNCSRKVTIVTGNEGTEKSEKYSSEYGGFTGKTINSGETMEMYVASAGCANIPSKGPDYYAFNLYSFLLLHILGSDFETAPEVSFGNYSKQPTYVGSVNYNYGTSTVSVHLYALTNVNNQGLPEVLEITMIDPPGR